MISIQKKSTIEKLLTIKSEHKEKERRLSLLRKLTKWPKELLNSGNICNILDGNVKSQNNQDLIIDYILNHKLEGFYIEFGADDGIQNSNSYLFSLKENWSGILIEPNKSRFSLLQKNRPNDRVFNELIYSVSDKDLVFIESGQLSTISEFLLQDFMSDERVNNIKNKYNLKSVSLTDFLINNNSPRQIDFLSIDTEGSEFEILKNFDFQYFNIKLICFEHNNTENKEKIANLLQKNNYSEVANFSNGVDSFFVRSQ